MRVDAAFVNGRGEIQILENRDWCFLSQTHCTAMGAAPCKKKNLQRR